MGALALAGVVADEAVDDLVDICENHHNGEDLTKSPFGIVVGDGDYAAMTGRISPHLEYGQCRM